MRALKNRCSTFVVFNIKENFLRCIVVLLLVFCVDLQAQSITELEYFFGNDPGKGNGTLVTAEANTGNLTQSIAIPLTGLPSGFHNLTFRAKDDANIWSLFSRQTFFVIDSATNEPVSNLAAAEYWFGADPGNGNGIALAISGEPSEIEESFVIPLGTLDAGFHTLSIRVKNLEDTWSLFNRETFFVIDSANNDPVSNLAAAEYWFGADPGNGNGIALAISGEPSEIEESFVIPLGTLDAGFHTLSIRVKNLDDTWSLFNRETFFVIDSADNDPVSNLAAAEYWFGTDPGNGNGIALAISGEPSEIEESFVIPLGNLEAGFHTLSIRVKNLEDTWSLFSRKTFYIINSATNDPPSPLTNAEFLYDANLGFGTGTEVAITPTGNPDEYIVEIPTDLVDCGLHNISLSVRNALGNYSLYNTISDIDVFDDLPPTIVVFQDIIVELDANGEAPPFTIANVNNGTFDDCELVSVVLNQVQFDYTCANLGPNTVTVTATDAEEKVSTLDIIVMVEDNIDPVVIGQNITLQLDASGNATTTADDLDDNSTDNCSITSRSLDISSFTCDNLGANTVILTVTDESGNQNTASVTVMVEDNISPVAIGQNITLQLDVNGSATITADEVDDNSTDNCSITSRSLDVSNFTCNNLGANTVMLTVTDQSGNQNTTSVTVMVEDNIDPVAIGQDIDISLDGNPSVSIIASDLDNDSNDNCGVVTLSIDVDTFTTTGVFPVILTVTDSFGNTSNVTVIVTVTNATLSVEEFNSDEIKVFPNPTANILYINFKQDDDYSFSVYDISGKEIFRRQELEINNTLSLFKYASGVYFLKIKNKTNNTIQNFKIIKM